AARRDTDPGCGLARRLLRRPLGAARAGARGRAAHRGGPPRARLRLGGDRGAEGAARDPVGRRGGDPVAGGRAQQEPLGWTAAWFEGDPRLRRLSRLLARPHVSILGIQDLTVVLETPLK